MILALFRTNGRLLRAGDRMMKDLGVTSARWQILVAITERPKTVAQIARDYELTRQATLWVVQAMLKEDLVELINNPDHKRAKLVTLTEKGKAVGFAVAGRQMASSNLVGTEFGMDELKVAHDFITRLGNAVLESEGLKD